MHRCAARKAPISTWRGVGHNSVSPSAGALPGQWRASRDACRKRTAALHSSPPDSREVDRGAPRSSSDEALESLDSLLALPCPPGEPPQRQALEPWWKLKPKQSAPPRRTSAQGGQQQGRFIADQLLGSSSGVRAGSSTALGDALQPPRAQPMSSYLLLLVGCAIQATHLQVGAQQGPGAADEFLRSLLAADPSSSATPWLHAAGWAQQPAHLLASALVTTSAAHQALMALALLTAGLELEAAIGPAPLLALYLLGGATASLACSLTGGPLGGASAAALEGLGGSVQGAAVTAAAAGSSSASGAAMALVACLLLHYGRNPQLPRPVPLGLAVAATTAGNLWLTLLPGARMDGVTLLAGLLAGGVMGLGLCARYQITREVDIPEGSMVIPEDAAETVVVVDQTTGLQRTGALLLYAAALGLAAAGVGALELVRNG